MVLPDTRSTVGEGQTDAILFWCYLKLFFNSSMRETHVF